MTTIYLEDTDLMAMAIPARNAYLDDLADEAERAQDEWEFRMDSRSEAWWEERGGSTYAGSPEEARDRFYDSLIGR